MNAPPSPAPPPAPPAEAEIYTLRVWRQPHQFRASVRAVGEEHSSFFTEPQSLADFLAGRDTSLPPAEGEKL